VEAGLAIEPVHPSSGHGFQARQRPREKTGGGERVLPEQVGPSAMTDQNKPEAHNEDGGLPATPVKPRSRKAPHKKPPRRLPPWRVMLHNDDTNAVDKVVQVIRKLTPLTKEEASARTREADKTGVALLLVTHQERAELYVEQFTSCGLTVTAEADR
jgi:ATP-dependent Clp protease adaptor protein ClpS